MRRVKWKLLFLQNTSSKIQPVQRLQDLAHWHQPTPLPIAHVRIQSHRLSLDFMSQKYSMWQVAAREWNIWGFICWPRWSLPAYKPHGKPRSKINGKARERINLQLLSAVKLYWRQVKVTQGFFTLNCSLDFILLSTALCLDFFHFHNWICHSFTSYYVLTFIESDLRGEWFNILLHITFSYVSLAELVRKIPSSHISLLLKCFTNQDDIAENLFWKTARGEVIIMASNRHFHD